MPGGAAGLGVLPATGASANLAWLLLVGMVLILAGLLLLRSHLLALPGDRDSGPVAGRRASDRGRRRTD